MSWLDHKLRELESLISEGGYQQLETDRFEIKSMPATGTDWPSLYQTICAFLNTNGGIILIGVREEQKPKKYVLQGYKPGSDDFFYKAYNIFTDENGNSIKLDSTFLELKTIQFLETELLAVWVSKLDEASKFVFYKGVAYERNLERDVSIGSGKIKAQKEKSEEYRNARELYIVPGTTMTDINLEKLNEYIDLINKETKVETRKPDIQSALSFLELKKFLIDGQFTTLGMLVCGNRVEDFLGGRCEVDGYIDMPEKVSVDKKVIKDNIISLMERSYAFVIQRIQIGISTERSGSPLPEYPLDLVRECINNALAHRDYSKDRFTTIVIKPGIEISIKNPGEFKAEQKIENFSAAVPIRRLIPNAKPQNPKLADVLKIFDKWEGRAVGMATLTNAALNNDIDLPFYRLSDNENIDLHIPKGKILDEGMQLRFNSFDKFIEEKLNGSKPTLEELLVLAYFYKSEIANSEYKYTVLLSPDNNHFSVIGRLREAGLIFLHPDSPANLPVFLVNRELLKDNFNSELKLFFTGNFDLLSEESKDVLNVVYQTVKYGKTAPNAYQVGMRLYLKKHHRIDDVRLFDSFNRKIRKVFQALTKGRFLIKTGEKSNVSYTINEKYSETPSLFSEL